MRSAPRSLAGQVCPHLWLYTAGMVSPLLVCVCVIRGDVTSDTARGGSGGSMLDTPTAPALPAARTVELSIRGMTCTACAARIEKKLTGIGAGVVAAVSFATEQATVTASAAVPVHAMIAAVEDAGYAAGLIAHAAAPAHAGD